MKHRYLKAISIGYLGLTLGCSFSSTQPALTGGGEQTSDTGDNGASDSEKESSGGETGSASSENGETGSAEAESSTGESGESTPKESSSTGGESTPDTSTTGDDSASTSDSSDSSSTTTDETAEKLLKPYRFESITIEDLKINYRIQGKKDGPTILFLHGAGDSLSAFDSMYEKLKQDYRLVSLDFPGHGLSEPLKNPLSYLASSTVSFIQEFVSKLKLEDFVLIGHGFGGDVAARYGLDNVGKLKGFVFIAPQGKVPEADKKKKEGIAGLKREEIVKHFFGPRDPKSPPKREDIRKRLESHFSTPEAVSDKAVERVFALAHNAPNRYVYQEQYVTFLFGQSDPFGLTSLQDVPGLLIWGDKDNVVPAEEVKTDFTNALKAAELVIFEGVGHNVMDEAPEKSADRVLEFLKTLK